MKGFLLKDQNLLSMMKLFAEEPLVAGCFQLNSKFISKSPLSGDVKIPSNTKLCVWVHRPARLTE